MTDILPSVPDGDGDGLALFRRLARYLNGPGVIDPAQGVAAAVRADAMQPRWPVGDALAQRWIRPAGGRADLVDMAQVPIVYRAEEPGAEPGGTSDPPDGDDPAPRRSADGPGRADTPIVVRGSWAPAPGDPPPLPGASHEDGNRAIGADEPMPDPLPVVKAGFESAATDHLARPDTRPVPAGPPNPVRSYAAESATVDPSPGPYTGRYAGPYSEPYPEPYTTPDAGPYRTPDAGPYRTPDAGPYTEPYRLSYFESDIGSIPVYGDDRGGASVGRALGPGEGVAFAYASPVPDEPAVGPVVGDLGDRSGALGSGHRPLVLANAGPVGEGPDGDGTRMSAGAGGLLPHPLARGQYFRAADEGVLATAGDRLDPGRHAARRLDADHVDFEPADDDEAADERPPLDEVDLRLVVERVRRDLAQQLTVERERRGEDPWR